MTQPYAAWVRAKSCLAKRRHATLVEANTAVLAHWRRGDWAWRYKCDGDNGCGGWHVTTDESTREAM